MDMGEGNSGKKGGKVVSSWMTVGVNENLKRRVGWNQDEDNSLWNEFAEIFSLGPAAITSIKIAYQYCEQIMFSVSNAERK